MVGRPRACSRRFLSSGKSPLPGVGDHHPDNLHLPPAGAYGPRLRGRQALAHESRELLGFEAVCEHDRFGTAKGVAGEQPERAALVIADALARTHRECTFLRFPRGG